ncbi:helix-turn-helix domain protein [Streptomyces scabiei]|uniref:Helix-turn-helix domain protein n=1 Tax=Streptomyces scabiei TaxID=1930 RepID=A0A100JHW3_STRSC|nr:helix-turn-helix domain protein [Streptomyces scabiei]
MQLRYAFRLSPNAAQQAALARAFGCARVVFNDAVRAREDARKARQPLPTAGHLSRKLITEAKQTAGRSWLGEVSAAVLQQSLRDAESAYRNFFASLKGNRKGAKLGAPRFKSRKDTRRHPPRPGPQRRTQHQNGRRTGGISLRSAGMTRSSPGTAQRNRKPRIPHRKPCRVAAQQPAEKARILALQGEEHVNAHPVRRRASQNRCQGDPAVRDEAVDTGPRVGLTGDGVAVRGQ